MINARVNFNTLLKGGQFLLLITFLAMLATSLSGCDSAPPKLMPAVKQFNTDKEKAEHLSHIRKDHMDLLLHKRDETMIKGIRTKKDSLYQCISCHVPEEHNGKVLRHTNPEHFCSSCHGYVAVQLDCFECHVDRPVSATGTLSKAPNDKVHSSVLAKNNTVEKKLENTVKKVVTGESASE